MATFIWRNVLTVTVGEMSRTRAIECCQQFDLLAGIYTNADDLLAETDVLCVLHAPTTVKVRGEVMAEGERLILLDEGESIRLTLPLTRECFMALPMTLTRAWIAAAVGSNDWLVDVLKKVFSLASETGSAQKSGDGPSSEPSLTNFMTKTTGTWESGIKH